MRKLICLTITLILGFSLLSVCSVALNSSYEITFPDYYEKTEENHWQTDKFMINDKATTILASVNFLEAETQADYIFLQPSLDLSKRFTELSEGFVKFIDTPCVMTVSPHKYRCIYQSYIVSNNGIESTVLKYNFYSSTQQCYIIFVASDPLFAHVEKTSEKRIVDTLTFEDDFFTEPIETTESTITTEAAATDSNQSNAGTRFFKVLILGSVVVIVLLTVLSVFRKKTASKTIGTQKTTNQTNDMLDDVTFIKAIKHTSKAPWQQYDILLAAKGYGWDTMLDWADYMTKADLEGISQVTTGSIVGKETDITQAYLNNGGLCKQTPELVAEKAVLSIAGLSRTLKAPMKIVWINQTNTLRLFTLVEDDVLISKYVETTVRRTFGTTKAMKLGKPLPNNPF